MKVSSDQMARSEARQREGLCKAKTLLVTQRRHGLSRALTQVLVGGTRAPKKNLARETGEVARVSAEASGAGRLLADTEGRKCRASSARSRVMTFERDMKTIFAESCVVDAIVGCALSTTAGSAGK
jgi:hypothetical protein